MKNNRFIYNSAAILRMLFPWAFGSFGFKERVLKDCQKRDDWEYIKSRIDYYNRLDSATFGLESRLDSAPFSVESISKNLADSAATPPQQHILRHNPQILNSDFKNLGEFRFTTKSTTYYFDTWEYLLHFPKSLKLALAPGDVNFFLSTPSITKSRPIGFIDSKIYGSNPCGSENLSYKNSILFNLNKIRHFTFINDMWNFRDKKDILFYRGGIYQAHRAEFFKKYFNNPLCDLGHTGNPKVHKEWVKPKVSIASHLPYKFILSLEGNDVASNLKWVMSSNSIAVMPRPKFETWFMEGTLKADYHYIEILPDYSDLEEKLAYYIANPSEAEAIIHNAHEYVRQFFDKKREDIIAFLVLEKYFYYTGQIPHSQILHL